MLAKLKGILPARLRLSLREALAHRTYAQRSYSQEGEDLVLQRLFEDRPGGVFVDVGAHHPFRFSNTSLLSQRGWRGINIDARPGSMASFRRSRPRDINLELGVSAMPDRLTYHLFVEPALNTFDADLASQRVAAGWPTSGTRLVECLPLATILARELPALGVTGFDLLTVDVEGLDLEVLRSSDWTLYRPRAVVAEVLAADLAGLLQSEVTGFMTSVGYQPHCKLVNSAVFLRSE